MPWMHKIKRNKKRSSAKRELKINSLASYPPYITTLITLEVYFKRTQTKANSRGCHLSNLYVNSIQREQLILALNLSMSIIYLGRSKR